MAYSNFRFSGTILSENNYMFMLLMKQVKIITYLLIFFYLFKGMQTVQVELVIVILGLSYPKKIKIKK